MGATHKRDLADAVYFHNREEAAGDPAAQITAGFEREPSGKTRVVSYLSVRHRRFNQLSTVQDSQRF